MQSRFYSPDLRRFINADLLHGDITNALTLNRYAYCNGDPVNGIDPLGLSKERGGGLSNPLDDAYFPSERLKSTVSDIKKAKAKDALLNTITRQYNWTQEYPFVPYFAQSRFEHAIYAIDEYKDTIMEISEKYDIPAEIIASIILKEQYTQSIPDFVANIHTLIFDEPHSVGLGAIFPGTAIASWQQIKDYGMIEFDYNDYGNYDMQDLLMNNRFNIETIAVVLLYENGSPDTSNADWHKLLEEYNGSPIYADYVSEYLDDMKEYLSYD